MLGGPGADQGAHTTAAWEACRWSQLALLAGLRPSSSNGGGPTRDCPRLTVAARWSGLGHVRPLAPTRLVGKRPVKGARQQGRPAQGGLIARMTNYAGRIPP